MLSTKKETLLRCSQTTATFIFILLGSLFILTGCSQLYKMIGLSPEQAAEQTAKDQESRGELVNQFRTTTSELVSYAIAGIGSIASGFLAKWLGTERKITAALITGIESAGEMGAKESVKAKATASGVESALHARVLKLT